MTTVDKITIPNRTAYKNENLLKTNHNFMIRGCGFTVILSISKTHPSINIHYTFHL